MCKIQCIQCERLFIQKKNSTEICGICKSKNKSFQEKQFNLETEKYKRNCPICNSKIVYKNKRRYLKALNGNCKCKKCTAIQQFRNLDKDIKSGRKENGFKGKTHSIETRNIISKSNKGNIHTFESRDKISKASKQMWLNNPNRSFYKSWIEKYGTEEADRRLDEFKVKISNATSGSNNPMYGKPSPQGSGNGWSGWYKDIYFRSLLELSFLVNWVDRFNLKIESAEKQKYGIKYHFNGKDRTYFADWVVNDNYLVEIKPKKLWNTPQNTAKFAEAIKYCKENDLIFKVIEPIKLTEELLDKLYETNQVLFNKKYEEKFKNK